MTFTFCGIFTIVVQYGEATLHYNYLVANGSKLSRSWTHSKLAFFLNALESLGIISITMNEDSHLIEYISYFFLDLCGTRMCWKFLKFYRINEQLWSNLWLHCMFFLEQAHYKHPVKINFSWTLPILDPSLVLLQCFFSMKKVSPYKCPSQVSMLRCNCILCYCSFYTGFSYHYN